MRALVTGATGFVGSVLCLRLAVEGHDVRALCRDPARARALAHPRVTPVRGDLLDAEALARATDGCDTVFHLAALAAVWAPDPADFDRVNVGGTRFVLEASRRAGVARVVCCSTAGVLGPSAGRPRTEADPREAPFFSDYERTKAAAEDLARAAAADGLPVVVVNPTRVYGPCPTPELPPLDGLISAWLAGRWRWLPGGGRPIGNYVRVDDVVDGLLRAAARGRPGERYLLGGEDASFAAFFEALERVTGLRRRMVSVPAPLMVPAAAGISALARLAGRAPPITPAWARRFLADWSMSSAKAEVELGYRPLGLDEGLAETVRWLRARPADG